MTETVMNENPEAPGRKSRAVATYRDKRAMENRMLDNSSPGVSVNEQIWHEGWSFKRVAQETNPEFNADHAKRVATDLGLTFLDPLPVEPASLEARIEALEDEVRRMSSTLHNLSSILMAEAYPQTEYDNVDISEPSSQVQRDAIHAGSHSGDGPAFPEDTVRGGAVIGPADRDAEVRSAEGTSAVG